MIHQKDLIQELFKTYSLQSTPKVVNRKKVMTIREGLGVEKILQRRKTPLVEKNHPLRRQLNFLLGQKGGKKPFCEKRKIGKENANILHLLLVVFQVQRFLKGNDDEEKIELITMSKE